VPEHERPTVAIACQGGGSHAAYAAGILIELMQPRHFGRIDLVGLSGTSGGAVCAALAWSGLIRAGGGPGAAADALTGFWEDLAAQDPFDRAVNAWTVGLARLPVTWEISPYFVQVPAEPRLRRLLERHLRLEELPRDPEARRRPALLIGATDILNGGGVAFEGADISYDDIIASAAVPPLFRAVRTRGSLYWDGLFSRNPPIREFKALRPDEIWVIRINPAAAVDEPTMMQDIIDRRNELAGNLALDHELHLIQLINGLRARYPAMREDYKEIAIREVELDLPLDYHSKLDRDTAHIERLMERGRGAAPLFFAPASLRRSPADPPARG
jgi:NTE family protein